MSDFDSLFSDLKLPLYGVRLPEFSIEDRLKKAHGLKEDASSYDFILQVCRTNFKKLNIPKDQYSKYSDRVKYELETIKELGFLDYIVLVWSVINYCDENSIPVGLGRGSAAGSLILYLLGVTKVDPIRYELFFERFISKIRAKKQVVDGITYLDGSLLCDVDLDICYYNRNRVIKFLEERFSGRTCKILTLTTLSGKILIKECGKIVDNKPETEMNEISSLIPKVFGQIKDLKEAYGEVPEFQKWCDANPRSYKTALKLRGLIKNKSVHASGMMLSYHPIAESCPTELTSDKERVSSYDMNWVSVFNVKLDLLGLRSVSVVNRVCELVKIKKEDIDFNDPFIYQQLHDLKNPHGIFQIEAGTNFAVCKKVKPKNLEELSGVLALSRPGALEFVDQYANYTNTGSYEGIHPFFDSVLKDSGGVAIFQEQLMKMSNKIGFTLDESEVLRRIVGKKKVEEVKKWKEKISDKIKENKLDPEIGDILWRILENSANYSFNKCAFEEELVEEKSRGKIMLKDVQIGDMVKAYDVDKDCNHFVEVLDVMTNERELREVTIEDGRALRISLEHKLLCGDGVMRPLEEIIGKGYSVLTDQCGEKVFGAIVKKQNIISIRPVGFKKTIDLEVNHKDHNFYAGGFVSSNSHSVSYSALAATTVYLKFKYPKEFFLALLEMTKHEPAPLQEISKIQKELRHFGIKLLGPHILKSETDFSIQGNDIRYGLSSIKGISEKTMEKLNNFKSEHSNKFEVFEAAKEVRLPIGVTSALIQAGALDGFSSSRSRVVLEAQLWNILTENEKILSIQYGPSHDFDLLKVVKALSETKNENGKLLIKESRLATIKKKYDPYLKIYQQNNKSESFANWYYENKLLGYSYDKSLKDIFMAKMPNLKSTSEIFEGGGGSVYLIGKVDEASEFVARNEKKTKTFKMTVSDEMGSCAVLMFNDKIEVAKSENEGKLPEEGDIVIIKGSKKTDCIFAETVIIQTLKIYTRLSELTEKTLDNEPK
jgi:DNA polymerase III alpha subunit